MWNDLFFEEHKKAIFLKKTAADCNPDYICILEFND